MKRFYPMFFPLLALASCGKAPQNEMPTESWTTNLSRYVQIDDPLTNAKQPVDQSMTDSTS